MSCSRFSLPYIVAKRANLLVAGLIVLLAAPMLAQTQIQARRAGEFVDSMGVNVHMESPYPPYSDYDGINHRLQALGMRHFRDEINRADPSFKDHSFIDEIRQIGGLGYTLCGLIAGGNDYPPMGSKLESAHVVPMIQSLLPTIDAVEGPNEPDGGSFVYGQDAALYPRGAIDESKDLWNIVKDNLEISALPVLAMSEGNPHHFERLAEVSHHQPIDYATFGNMHAYQGGLTGDSGLPHLYIPDAQAWTLTKPLWTTEMGYHNYTHYLSNEQQGVSQRASAIYLPSAFLSGFDREVLRTFSYELIDEVNDPNLTHACTISKSGLHYCSGEGHYGLLNYDGTPKPAFTALTNLITLLRDPGSNDFDPGSLAVSFSGAPSTLRYTLLRKSNGDFYLALWNDIPVYQLAMPTAPGDDLYPQNVPVTINFSTPQALTVYVPNDSSGVAPTSAYTISTTPQSIQLALPPEVLLLEIVEN